MLVIIDESGCTGFKLSSSPYLVMAAVIFSLEADAEEASRRIEKLRRQYGYKREFKFSSSPEKAKHIFFDAVASVDFSVNLAVVAKRSIIEREYKDNPLRLYRYTLKKLLNLESRECVIKNASIKIDGTSNPDLRKAIAAYLRDGAPPSAIRSIRFVDSRKDNLVQLADMVTGLLARPYNSPTKSAYKALEAIIKPRITYRSIIK